MFMRAGLIAAALLAQAHAHMQLYYPPPFNASYNPNTKGKGDPYLLFPYDCCGDITPFPCRGYLPLLGTPAGAPTASWSAGSTQHLQLIGPAPYGGNHYGGSCQASFSIDKGKTFRVVKSWEGDCPIRGNGQTDPSKQDFAFNVPSDLPMGEAVFAWTWVNREQEFFMNCAAVSITGANSGNSNAGASSSASSSSTRSSSLPANSLLAPRSSSSTTLTKATSSSTRSSTSSAASPTSSAPSYDMDGCTCACPKTKSTRDGSTTLSSCTCYCPSTPDKVRRSIDFHPEEPLVPVPDPVDSNPTVLYEDSIDAAQLASRNQFGFGGGLFSPGKHARELASDDDDDKNEDVAAPAELDKRATSSASIAFNSRPLVFVANIQGRDCKTPKTDWELKYPNPGPDVAPTDGEYELKLPTGSQC